MTDPNERFDFIVKKLKEINHKLTPQRLAFAKIVACSEGHPSVEKIYESLQDNFPTMSLATVYRNVMLLKSLGEVLELGFPDGSNRYDGNKPYPHPHVLCVKCQKIIDPELASLKDMTAEVVGRTRESTQEDLFNAIERGDFPKWRFGVQVMPEEDADKTPCNPFDLTKVRPHGDYPLIDVAIIELNRNPNDYFAEVEQAAFAPSNIVPGIGFSPDKMLQARIFAYADAHHYGLGTHYEALPINALKCPMNHYHKDGKMRFFPNNPNPDAYYELNSFKGPVESPDFAEPPLKISGNADRYDHREGNDDYGQPRALFNLFDDGQKARLFSNIAEAMQGVSDFIIERQLGHFEKVHPNYAAGVNKALSEPA